jgi:hypothetical protein
MLLSNLIYSLKYSVRLNAFIEYPFLGYFKSKEQKSILNKNVKKDNNSINKYFIG